LMMPPCSALIAPSPPHSQLHKQERSVVPPFQALRPPAPTTKAAAIDP
jgi:hypothetical protein